MIVRAPVLLLAVRGRKLPCEVPDLIQKTDKMCILVHQVDRALKLTLDLA